MDKQIALDANHHTEFADNLFFGWPSIESVAEILPIMHHVASLANTEVKARTFDFHAYSRQLGIIPHEKWKAQLFMENGYAVDNRVQMGRSIAAHAGQQLSDLISVILKDVVENEDWPGIRTPQAAGFSDEQRRLLKDWQAVRDAKRIGKDREARFVNITPFQDDLIVVILGEHAEEKVRLGIKIVLSELGLKLSQMEKANRPSSSTLFALGAKFKLDGPRPTILPPKDELEKLQRLPDEVAGRAGILSLGTQPDVWIARVIRAARVQTQASL